MTTLAAAVRWNETLASLWADERVSALADGKLCLTTLGEVEKVLRPDNWKEVLPRFFGTSKRQAEVLAAGLLPAGAAPRRDIIVPLPALPPEEANEFGIVHAGGNELWPTPGGGPTAEGRRRPGNQARCPRARRRMLSVALGQWRGLRGDALSPNRPRLTESVGWVSHCGQPASSLPSAQCTGSARRLWRGVDGALHTAQGDGNGVTCGNEAVNEALVDGWVDQGLS